jgi:hypothetical protein
LDEDDRRALHAVWRARAGRFPRRETTDEATTDDRGEEEP